MWNVIEKEEDLNKLWMFMQDQPKVFHELINLCTKLEEMWTSICMYFMRHYIRTVCLEPDLKSERLYWVYSPTVVKMAMLYA